MAAIVYSEASDELTQVRGPGYTPLSPIDDGARVRVKRFSYTATGVVADTAVIELVEVPSGAVVIDTVLSDVTIAGAGEVAIGYATKSLPTDDNAATLIAAGAAAAVSAPAARGLELGEGIQSIIATVDTAALAADDTLTGFILYVVNT